MGVDEITVSAGIPNGPVAKLRYIDLRCTSCGNLVSMSPASGFCRRCGDPICALCASSTVETKDSHTSTKVPLLVVNLTQTTTVSAQSSVCGRCRLQFDLERKRAMQVSAASGTAILFGTMLPLLLAGVGGTFPFCFPAFLGVVLWLLLYSLLLRHYDEKYRACCPVCGSDMMGAMLHQAMGSGQPGPGMPNHVSCACGYQGPRVPLEGFWVFVDRHGPAPLEGSPLFAWAQHSWQVRHGRKGFWSGLFGR